MSTDDRQPAGNPGRHDPGGIVPTINAVADLVRDSDVLQVMFNRQWHLQTEITKKDVLRLTHEERVEYVHEMHTAIVRELSEMLDEISWKSWARSTFFHRQAYLKELVDILHFWMNLVLAAGLPETGTTHDLVDEVTWLYFEKANVNSHRVRTGYDGISTKCACGRAIDDGVPSGTGQTPDGALLYLYECPCGRYSGLVQT